MMQVYCILAIKTYFRFSFCICYNHNTENMDLRAFKEKAEQNKSRLRRIVTKIENDPPKDLDKLSVEVDKQVWSRVQCLSCGNCCRQMTPTFTPADVKRIATHLKMTPKDFKEKWLYKDKGGDWMNRTQPCQFFNEVDFKCSIYEVRPKDCAEFPHFIKKDVKDYLHIHKQNIVYCPAAFDFVETLNAMIKERKKVGG